jgi:hypothetical protein
MAGWLAMGLALTITTAVLTPILALNYSAVRCPR